MEKRKYGQLVRMDWGNVRNGKGVFCVFLGGGWEGKRRGAREGKRGVGRGQKGCEKQNF